MEDVQGIFLLRLKVILQDSEPLQTAVAMFEHFFLVCG